MTDEGTPPIEGMKIDDTALVVMGWNTGLAIVETLGGHKLVAAQLEFESLQQMDFGVRLEARTLPTGEELATDPEIVRTSMIVPVSALPIRVARLQWAYREIQAFQSGGASR